MKKSFLLTLMMGIGMSASAQQITVAEPEFVSCYFLLTSDSTYIELPKENGVIKKHENKVSKWSKIASGVSGIAGAAGFVGLHTAGSASGALAGAKVMNTALGVSNAAGSVSTLAGAEGMDIVFEGKASSYEMSLSNDSVQIIISAETNETNPIDLYRLVRLKTTKKDRRVQWIEYSPLLLGTTEAEENGYINFTGTKYGEHSYLLTIPSASLTKGQYAVFYVNISSALSIPVATFGIE